MVALFHMRFLCRHGNRVTGMEVIRWVVVSGLTYQHIPMFNLPPKILCRVVNVQLMVIPAFRMRLLFLYLLLY